MKWRQFGAGVGVAASLAAGGTIAADNAINPYTDTGAQLEMRSESVTPDAGSVAVRLDKDRPAATLSKWNDEASFTVSYGNVRASGSRAFLSNRMEWKGEREEVHAYPLDADDGMEDGGFEIEVVLSEKPASNVFTFAVEGAADLDFFYQPPLTDEEIEQGAGRPENVVGSYAVYHKAKANHVEGQTNYATGKAFHIYRPRAIDANGAETWAELSYEAGVLSVTVPQKFLDSAAYPVRVDPTFGYTSTPASNAAFVTNGANATRFTAPADVGTVSKLTAYFEAADFPTQFKGVIWLQSTLAIVTNGVTNSANISATGAADLTFASPPTLTPSADYYVGTVVSTAGSLRARMRYDSTASANYGVDNQANNYTTPANLSANGTTVKMYGIYATYTTSGGGSSSPPQNTIFFE